MWHELEPWNGCWESFSYVPKPEPFDGSGNWKTFYTCFTTYVNGRNFNGPQRIDCLCQFLEGEPREFCKFLLFFYPDMDFYELVYALKDHCALTLSLRLAQQNVGETLSEWAVRVIQLASQAFPYWLNYSKHEVAINTFCGGMYDFEAGQYVADLDPQTLEKAFYFVKLYHQQTSRAASGEPKKNVYHSSEDSSDSPLEIFP